jgi:hypothetical protein
MPRLRFYFVLCAALGLMGGAGCGDAPRDNPLDPLSDGFRDEGAISGRVTGLYPPFPGRPGVQVRLIPVGPAGRPELATRTDDDGRFALNDVPAGPYAVQADEEGFAGEVDTVTVTAGAVAEATIQLDALPVVTEQSLRSVHILRWPPLEPVFQLEVEATAEDPDRPQDLAGASLVVPGLDFSAELVETEPGTGVFAATFDERELPPPGVEALLGQTVRIKARDVSGNAGFGPPQSLVRVIEQSPQTQSPQFPDVVSTRPTLVWQPAQLPFAFTYRVDVFVVNAAGIPTLIDRYENIDPNQTALQVQRELASGEDHFWTVWVVDAFGNRSRSREAGFTVQ